MDGEINKNIYIYIELSVFDLFTGDALVDTKFGKIKSKLLFAVLKFY